MQAAESTAAMTIEQPVHGAILNHRHGKTTPEGLLIEVRGKAPAGAKVSVNGVVARREGDAFSAAILLQQHEPAITAQLDGRPDVPPHKIQVVWDKNSFPRYRFSIDDNSFFLRDVAQKGYRSLFDCFYLAILRDLNQKYGAKFVLNIYYTTGDGFDLPQFPDRYRSQWQDNAGWLRLAFHAYANKPDRPYQDAPPEKLLADMDLVNAQILRFAGEAALSPPSVIHWGMTRQSALKPLYQRGVRNLSGYFKIGARYDVNYNFDATRSEYVHQHDYWKDFDSGIIFSRVDIVCNNTPVEKTIQVLEPLTSDPNHAEVMDLFTHEQYFWPFYFNYVPDHGQRLETAIRFVTERGYKPVFLHEGLCGAPV